MRIFEVEDETLSSASSSTSNISSALSSTLNTNSQSVCLSIICLRLLRLRMKMRMNLIKKIFEVQDQREEDLAPFGIWSEVLLRQFPSYVCCCNRALGMFWNRLFNFAVLLYLISFVLYSTQPNKHECKLRCCIAPFVYNNEGFVLRIRVIYVSLLKITFS